MSYLSSLFWLAAGFMWQTAPPPANGAGAFVFQDDDVKVLEQYQAVERQFERRGLIFHDPVAEAHLAALARPFLPAPPLERVEWRFRLLRDPLPNAFALPGGSVYLTTGLIALLENYDQLAGVLAHEVAHVRNRHPYLELRDYRKKQLRTHLVKRAFGMAPFGVGFAAYLLDEAGEGASNAITAGYNPYFEQAADDFAVAQLREHGRDPAQILRGLVQMDRKLDPPTVRTIYTDSVRIKARIAYLQPLVGTAPNTAAGEDAYLRAMRVAIRQNIRLDLESLRFRTAVARSRRLVTANPDDAGDLCMLAEAYTALGPRAEALSPREMTEGGQRQAGKRIATRTKEEEERTLVATAEGRAHLQANRDQAERLFRQALAIDARQAAPHRGLGMLYEQQGRAAQALDEYRKYLELAPDAPDRLRIERRIAVLVSTPKLP
jgi:beta-barrel assembly-enhancing protease